MTYTIYLAGPMSNIPEFNFPKFFDAAAYLRQIHGWDVLSPAEKDLESIPWDEMVNVPGFDTGNLALYVANSTFTMSNAMEWDLPAIQKSDGIVLLDGWETSTGARWERAVAEALDRDIWLLHAEPGATGLPEWELERDDDPKQLTNFMKSFGVDPPPAPYEVVCEANYQGLVTDEDTLRWLSVIALLDDEAPQFRVEVPAGGTEHENLERARAYVDDQLEQLHKLPWPVSTDFPEGPSCPLPRPVDQQGYEGEVRVVDATTGGAKGTKLARFDLLPSDAIWKIAEHFGRGARKYADRNWEQGFDWSLAYAAAQRHLARFWMGQDVDHDPSLYATDEEHIDNPVLHITAAAWECIVLLAFVLRDVGNDNRPSSTPTAPRWEASDLR